MVGKLTCASVHEDTPSLAPLRTMEIPNELDGAKVLKYATVSGHVEPTGATRDTVGGVEVSRPGRGTPSGLQEPLWQPSPWPGCISAARGRLSAHCGENELLQEVAKIPVRGSRCGCDDDEVESWPNENELSTETDRGEPRR